MSFCLPKLSADKFIQALKSGEIQPEKLSDMTSADRRAFFTGVVGEAEAKDVNALFESRLLLKNQRERMVTWAKQLTGIKEPARRDLIATIERLDKVLDPADEHAFLEDLASKRLGVDVSADEAKQITELHKNVAQARADRSTEEMRLAYGHSILNLHDYVESLKGADKNPITNLANLPKTVMSTFDLSAPLRQGWGMMSRPQWYAAFAKMLKYAASEGAYRDLQADIISRPTYDLMKRSGLRISSLADKLSQREEQFMSTLVQKIPGVRGSERAYVGFLNKLRADTFDALIRAAEVRGEDIRPGTQATKDIASVVNDFTGSGNIGKGDKYANAVPALNAAFFSPRKISATINMLNPMRYASPAVSKTARIAALRQLVGSVAITITVLSLAKLAGAKVETDPRSSDFGKAVFGSIHYDLTGGNGTYTVLLARLAADSTKSTTSGRITELGKGYKPETRADLTLKFGRNKLSPVASLIADWFYGSDAVGQPFSAPQEVLNRVVPLIGQDVYQIEQNDPKSTFTATVGDLFGVGVQQY